MSARELTNRRIDLERRVREEEDIRNRFNTDNNRLVNEINYLNTNRPPIIKNLEIEKRNLDNKNKNLIIDNANYRVIIPNSDLLLNSSYLTEDSFTKSDNDAIKKKTISLATEYSYLIKQNEYLSNRYDYIKEQFDRHDNKHIVYSKNFDNLNILYTILFFSYYLLILGAIYILYFNKPTWKMYFKIILLILFLLFPFVIYSIEKILYNSWIYLYSIISGNVYNNMSYSNKVVLNNTTDLTTKE
jgi:hypothetical protein